MADSIEDTIRLQLEEMLAGRVVWLERHARWRPAWNAEVLVDGVLKRVNVRAEKGAKYRGPLSLAQEAGVHHVLARYGVRAPHVYGMMDSPTAIVMELLPGQINLATARDEAARAAIREQYISAIAAMHAIPLHEFAALGLDVPADAVDVALNLYRPCERIYREGMAREPFAIMEFIGAWLRRNVLDRGAEKCFISADAGQFLFEGDRLTGLIDFEVGYIGDPLAEFAGLRLRDTVEPLGDISALLDRYEQVTGRVWDKRTVEYHTAGFAAVTGWLMWPLVFNPDIDDHFVAYLDFCVGTTRWSIRAIAESLGVSLPDIAAPERAAITFPSGPAHLVNTIGRLEAGDAHAAYERSKAESLARYLDRCNLYGRSIQAANLHDASTLLGERCTDPGQTEKSLCDFVLRAGPERDAAIAGYCHAWIMRQDFLLQDTGFSDGLTGRDLQVIKARS